MPASRSTNFLRATWPFALLCLLAASRWIAADQWPQTGSTLRSEAAACALTAMATFLFSQRRRRFLLEPEPAQKPLRWATFAGAALLALPSLGAALSGSASKPFNRTAAMCFVPLAAAICAGIRSGSGMTGLGAPLAGVAGALFLFPLALPVDATGWAGLILPPLAVGILCGLWTESLPTHLWLFVAFAAGGAVGLMLIETLRVLLTNEPGGHLSLVAVTLDVAVIACTLLSLRGLGTERYATRYLWVPAVTVVEGVFLFHPAFSLRVWTGITLMVTAAILFWRRRSVDDKLTAMTA